MGKTHRLKSLALVLTILVLGLSHLLSSEAIPLSRTLLMIAAQGYSMTEAEHQEPKMETEENFVNRRIEMEIARDDYQSGPNRSHDPRTPAGRS
ncbi:unnamed protein product [Victoria cruziana]